MASARAKSAIDYLAHADQVGLDPTDYPTPNFKADMSADALAEAELKLTDTALTFAREAQTGRISFSRVGYDIYFHPVAPEPAEVLAKLAGSDDAGKALDGFNPPQPEFKALREKLAELRSERRRAKPEVKAPPQVHIAEGKILRPGMKDERVIALRKRLNIAGNKNDPLYDEAHGGGERLPARRRHRRRRHARPQHRARAQRQKADMQRRPSTRSTRSSSIWSVGAGFRATSAIRT